MDMNKDMKLSREEWATKYGEAGPRFDVYDANGDGVVDADEFIRSRVHEVAAMCQRVREGMHPNADKKITLYHFQTFFETQW